MFSDQQRRQNNALHNVNILQQNQNTIQNKEEAISAQQQSTQNQQTNSHPFKSKNVTAPNTNNVVNKGSSTTTKDCTKSKTQDEDVKIIKQEGQKPTMESQGPPPPPTSQYFLHPSYIAPTAFGFDSNHPMYRNVLMPSSSSYNAPPYHIPITRYHAPEDLSRNSGTKALDALHQAATQYYSNHKIHELSERALKLPNAVSSSGSNNIKGSGSSSNINTIQQPNINTSNQINTNLTSVSAAPQPMIISNNKPQDISQKSQLSNNQGAEIHKQNSSPHNLNSGNTISSASVGNIGSGTDSRSPPPQRHVHTHHHTHVGLGYPMYPAPYGGK